MAALVPQAKKLVASWSRRPSRGVASSLRAFYGASARKLPLRVRSELCLALGEAAELDGRFDHARWIYAAAVNAIDPQVDERLYTRAALRSVLNASRLGEDAVLRGVASLLEKLKPEEQTPRLAFLGAFARGLERFLREDYEVSRRAFEAAMGASWESGDADSEALSHHLLSQVWSRLGRLSRAREHAEAALVAARKAGSWILEQRLALECAKHRLRAGMAPDAIAAARALVLGIRRLKFPRFESLAWTKIAQGILVDRVSARALLTRSEGLLPDGHPDRAAIHALQALLKVRADGLSKDDRTVAQELEALVKLARS